MPASKYDPSYNDLAKSVARVCGATDEQLAEIIGIGESTLYDWKVRHPAFAVAIQEGKDEYDNNRVEKALLDIALGYEHDDTDIRVANGDVITTPIIKKYPPNFAAIKHWQMNRDRKRWAIDQKVEHSGDIGINVSKDEAEL